MPFGFHNVDSTANQVHIFLLEKSRFCGPQSAAIQQSVKYRDNKMSGWSFLVRPKAVSTVEERFYLRFIEDMWNIPRTFAGHGYGNHICFCSNSPKVLCKLPYDHNAISVACCVFRISFLQPCKCEFTIQTIFFRKPFYTEIVKPP